MRLLQYITESPADKRECSKMIKFYNSHIQNPLFFWRGVGTNSINDVEKKKPHLKSRNPMSTGQGAHDHMNKIFTEQFGWPVRNGIATTSKWASAEGYGYPRIFLPTNDFEFAWHPKINDLWAQLPYEFVNIGRNQRSAFKDVQDLEEQHPEMWANLEKNVNRILKGFKNNDLEGALQSGNEVYFKCKHYYLIDERAVKIAIGQELTGRGWDWGVK